MRHLLILLCGVCLNSAWAGPTPIPEKYLLKGHAEFGQLSKEAASEKGQKMAKADFEAGIYRVLVYGKRRTDSPEELRLRDKYSVYLTPIAGCIVSDGILGAAEGYNGTMKPLLQKKFGEDIFKEH